MKKIKHIRKIKIISLAIILAIISAVFIIACGDTYTIKSYGYNGDTNSIKINVEDSNIIEKLDEKIEDDCIKIKIHALSQGKTHISIDYQNMDASRYFSVYVHKFNIITINDFFGDSRGSFIIPISITILLVYIMYVVFTAYRQNQKKNLYQYKNTVYLGIIVFLAFSILAQIFSIFNYSGLINTINDLIDNFSMAIYLLPMFFIISILVIISNMVLIKREGFNLTNVLGLLLGLFICITTILPDILYNMLFSAKWIDIHNQNSWGPYVYELLETTIFIIVSYLECVLIGTIIMGIKSARKIPKFDKDAIIILGCQIKKDGTLTNLLKGRVDRAIEFAKMQKENTGKDILFVPSGGKGDDEIISEAQAMKNYLLENGIQEKDIIIEDKSRSTYENIKFSNQLIKNKIDNPKIAFSTTNYHVFRAGNIANDQNCYMEGIGAKTKPYFWINAFIREFIATLFSEKRKHFIAVICMIIFVAIMIAITYFNYNI